ncbi:MAG: PIN domain-containing protein [Thermomicrobiales bacterium]
MDGSVRFVDTSVLLRLLLRDDEAKAEQTVALLLRMERGEITLATSHLVIFETIFTLQRRHGTDRSRIREIMRPIIDQRNLLVPDKPVLRRALDLYVTHRIAFADAYNAAEMESRGIDQIYAWDTHYSRIPGITLLSPGQE